VHSFNWCGELTLGLMRSYICSIGRGSCMCGAFFLHSSTVPLVSEENSISSVTGSFLPLAERELSPDEEEHLNRSNQSSSMLHKTLGGRISVRKHLSCLCRKSLLPFRSCMSSSVHFVALREPSFNARRRFS